MFLGEHQHNLDAKGRVILPVDYRGQLGAGACMTSERDGCLAVWAPDEFKVRAGEMTQKLRGNARDRGIARAFFGGAEQRDVDRQGRLAIPPHLRSFAELEREVAVVGMFDHLEIWDAARWVEHKQSGERDLAEGDDE